MRVRSLLRTSRSGLPARVGGLTAQAESVLVLEADVVAAAGPPVSLLVEQSGMQGEPVGLVEVGRFTVPALVMGFEPDGPFAGSFAGEQAGKPGGPDVGEIALSGRHGADSTGRSWGLPRVYRRRVVGRYGRLSANLACGRAGPVVLALSSRP